MEPESENLDVTVGGDTTTVEIMDYGAIDAAFARIIAGFAELRIAFARGCSVTHDPPPTSES